MLFPGGFPDNLLMRGSARSGALHPLWVAIPALILAVLAALVLGVVSVHKAKERGRFDKVDKESTLGMADEFEKAIEGQELSGKTSFPDTPIGNMNRILYDNANGLQKRERAFEKELDAIGWDWVMSPDSMRTKKSLQEALRRVNKTRETFATYRRDYLRNFEQLLERLKPYSLQSRDARDYYAGLRNAAKLPGSGTHFMNRTAVLAAKNHDAIENALRFLLRRVGRYSVADDGTIYFSATVPQREVDAFNKLNDTINSTAAQISNLDRERVERARFGLQRMREELAK